MRTLRSVPILPDKYKAWDSTGRPGLDRNLPAETGIPNQASQQTDGVTHNVQDHVYKTRIVVPLQEE